VSRLEKIQKLGAEQHPRPSQVIVLHASSCPLLAATGFALVADPR
jgi:hypothetical protein